ncbi:acyl-CoA carboxylase subunit beta [Ruminococcus gauvreauii]|uniref:Carboxyl transferase n=1 Tax=Ruminococcus gauvreauii TaxID=438033 RepID=A0ABY5VIA3_9FIRM|nr:carboxyl transferase domain-containing protein [Ruminococcus gauvreauii]UWP59706.1 carboxyl transferase [Ruminococcus gauvreauii]
MSNTTVSAAMGRINALLDANSFVEIGGQITARSTDFNLSETETPSDGVITGYGVIEGSMVYVYSQDASVLKGTIGEMHAGKIVRLYELAMKTGAPVLGFLDCAGMRLQEATDALHALGEIYRSQVMASGVIPQITGIFGSCGGGLAIVPGLTDFTFMEKETGHLFVNSPNAIDGNEKSKCDTSSAVFQGEETGLADKVGTEAEILSEMRRLIVMLPENNEDDSSYIECTDDLNRICEQLENSAGDAALMLTQLADAHEFLELKKDYGKDMTIGFLRLNGMTVGAVANRSEEYDADGNLKESFGTVLSARGARKAADFIRFCDAFQIPLLTVTNVTGFKATKCAETHMAKSVAAMTYAFTEATVPKVNVITRKAYGSAYVAMNSRALGADMVFAWRDAKIGMMDARAAAKLMYIDEGIDVIDRKAAEYEALQDSAASAARRGYVDAVIDPKDTRKHVIAAFEMLFTKREDRPGKKHGTV